MNSGHYEKKIEDLRVRLGNEVRKVEAIGTRLRLQDGQITDLTNTLVNERALHQTKVLVLKEDNRRIAKELAHFRMIVKAVRLCTTGSVQVGSKPRTYFVS